LNYLMLNIGMMVTLFDFGFSPQFTRSFSYIFSGAQELKKEGVYVTENNGSINYKLLKNTIATARLVYRYISLFVLFIMLSLGTLYIYITTYKFTLVNNALLIWIIYSFSVFFNIYYSYLNSILVGKGDITGSRKCIVYSKIIYLLIAIVMLFLNFKLISIVIANLIAPIVQRFLSYKYFYDKEIRNQFINTFINKNDIRNVFESIWHNTKKMGFVTLGAFAINRSSMFFAGLFLSLNEVASYGLMQQLVGSIGNISLTMFIIHQPKFASYLVNNDKENLLKEFSFTMGFFYIAFLSLSILLIFIGNPTLKIIKSNSVLPSTTVMIFYCLITLLEQNHSSFATIISLGNTIPFVKQSLISGFAIIIGLYISLSYFKTGIMGLVLVPGIVQAAYNNWKWPMVVCKDFGVSNFAFIKMSLIEILNYIKRILNGTYRFFKK